jgi:hypothetical protein
MSEYISQLIRLTGMPGKRKSDAGDEGGDEKKVKKEYESGRYWINHRKDKSGENVKVEVGKDPDAYPAVFCFYSLSSDDAAGKGTGEDLVPTKLDETHLTLYNMLSRMKFEMPIALTKITKKNEGKDTFQANFRQMLSNFCRCCDFMYEGETYATVEHAFHATKFLRCSERYKDDAGKSALVAAWRAHAAKFTIDGGIRLPLEAKKQGGKGGGFELPNDFFTDVWSSNKNHWMQDIQMHKLVQCYDHAHCGRQALVVLCTKDAALMHTERGRGKAHFLGLEAWRDMMWNLQVNMQVISELKRRVDQLGAVTI